MISASDAKLLDHLAQCLEEKYWSDRIAEAEKSGYLSIEESNKILQEALGDDLEPSPNAMDTNWGGVKYSRKVVASGIYDENTRKKD